MHPVEKTTAKSQESRSSVMRLVGSCAVLCAAVAPVAVLIGALAAGNLREGAFSALVAAGICCLASSLALVVGWLGNVLHLPVQGVLVGMLFRMGLPLMALLVLPQSGGPLASSNVAPTLLGVYLVTLVVETALALRLVPPHKRTLNAV
jgi:hypothetical protein